MKVCLDRLPYRPLLILATMTGPGSYVGSVAGTVGVNALSGGDSR